MDIFRIRGGNPLHGKVQKRFKNSLPLLGFLLTEEETILENVPDLGDINFMAEILTELGAEVRLTPILSIKPSSVVHYALNLVRKMRHPYVY